MADGTIATSYRDNKIKNLPPTKRVCYAISCASTRGAGGLLSSYCFSTASTSSSSSRLYLSRTVHLTGSCHIAIMRDTCATLLDEIIIINSPILCQTTIIFAWLRGSGLHTTRRMAPYGIILNFQSTCLLLLPCPYLPPFVVVASFRVCLESLADYCS